MGRAGKGAGVTDERVVSLETRRPKRSKPISGAAIFANSAFQLPFMKTHHEPRWTATGQTNVVDDEPWPIDGSLVAHALDDDTPLGWVDRNEHSLIAEFVVGPEHAAMVQQVALSPVAFSVIVNFSSDDQGAVTRLELSIIRNDPA